AGYDELIDVVRRSAFAEPVSPHQERRFVRVLHHPETASQIRGPRAEDRIPVVPGFVEPRRGPSPDLDDKRVHLRPQSLPSLAPMRVLVRGACGLVDVGHGTKAWPECTSRSTLRSSF